ncbi:Hypothetical predicted protein [Xyrichtys novacula]|uniref:Uncharacterized protein n=1 Tax=Xyrichtys novacula TaxID=13765 RepID=A0AAV1G8H7_XYRNO|nr:Hypothetical predicted protein [Xyrichtys novacula]
MKKKTNHSPCKTALRYRNVSHHGHWRAEVCGADNKPTCCFSELGGKQMLLRQAKHTQTPDKFMEVTDPGRPPATLWMCHTAHKTPRRARELRREACKSIQALTETR